MDGGTWKAAVHGVAEGRTRWRDFTFTFHFHGLEKEMATHSSVLAWRIPGTGEPGGLPSMGSHRVGHDWSDSAAAAAVYIYSCIKMVNLHPMKQLYQLGYSVYIQFLLPLILEAESSTSIVSASFTPSPSMKLFHKFIIHLCCFHHLMSSILVSPKLLNDFSSLHQCPPVFKVLWVFTNAWYRVFTIKI